MVLQGFVDDSGTSSGNIFTLAGFISTAERWMEFSDEWEKICDREPKMLKFKMNKVRQLVGPHYSELQLTERIRVLSALTKKKAIYRIDAVTAHPNYEQIVKGQIPKEIDSIYFILFFTVIFAAARLMDMGGLEGTVDFVFDKQGKTIEADCVRWYNWIKEHPQVPLNVKRRLGSTPVFRDDDLVLPLKAADMLAWHIRRHLNEEQKKGIPAGEYLKSIGEMFGASCIIRQEDLASLVYAIKGGLMLQSQCGFVVPKNEEERARLLS